MLDLLQQIEYKQNKIKEQLFLEEHDTIEGAPAAA